MSGVLFLFQFLLLISLFSVLTGRWLRLQALVWGLAALAALWMVAQWPGDRPVLVLGREVWLQKALRWQYVDMVMDPLGQQVWRVLWLSVLLWSLVAFIVPSWGKGLKWLPFPLLLGIPALTIQSTWALGWALVLAAVGNLILLYGGTPGNGRGVWQWLLPLLIGALALTFLLLPPDPNVTTVAPWRLVVIALFLVLVAAVVPVHVGGVTLAQAGRPLGVAWLWWGQTLLFIIAWKRAVSSADLVPAQWQAQDILQFLAWITLVWAGIGALGASRLRRLWGYAALYNWALTLALWLLAPTSLDTWRWTLVVRWFALGASALALTTLLPDGIDDDIHRLSGWARRRPWAVSAWAAGVATLAGVPFTPGFWSQWLLHVHTTTPTPLPWMALVGGVAIMLGVVRALVALWGPLHEPLLVREDGRAAFLLGTIAIAILAGALWPRWLIHLGALLW